MAGPRKKRRNEDRLRIAVGAMAIALVAGFLAASVLLEGRHFGAGVEIKVELMRVGKLGVGSPVKISSKTIGQIERIEIARRDQRVCPPEERHFADPRPPGQEDAHPPIWVTLWVRQGQRDNLRWNSEYFVNQGSILAPQYIEVLPPPLDQAPGELVKEGQVVCGVTPAPTDRLLTKSLENMRILRAAADQQRPAIARFSIAALSLWSTLQSLQNDPGQLGRIAGHVRALFRDGDALLSDLDIPHNGARLRKLAARFRATVRALEADVAQLGAQVAVLRANLDRLGSILPAQRRRALAANLKTFQSTLADARRILATADQITQAIADAEGTIGLMLADRELFDDFKTMSRILKNQPFNTMGVPPAVVDEP